MNICIITYGVPHKKTADVFWGLYLRGFKSLSFLEVPFQQRAGRNVVFQHRPMQFSGASGRSIARAFQLQYYDYEDRMDALNENDYLVICGANLLESEFANSRKVVNCHAGLIPAVRGLDSLKWAIYNRMPVGNTLHIIDEEADKGIILHQMQTVVFEEDELESFAERHYRNELWLLSHFDLFLENGEHFQLQEAGATRRMPKEIELELAGKFDEYKSLYLHRLDCFS